MTKRASSLSNPLINHRLRFLPTMVPYSNDAPYCLPSCKKSETFNGQFPIFEIPAVLLFVTLLTPNITSCNVSDKKSKQSL